METINEKEKLEFSQNKTDVAATLQKIARTEAMAIEKETNVSTNQSICSNELSTYAEDLTQQLKNTVATGMETTAQNNLEANEPQAAAKQQENSVAEDSKNVSHPLDLICSNKAAGVSIMECKDRYRDAFVDISLDSEEDSDSWEDESDSSTSSSSSSSTSTTSSSSSFASGEDSDFDINTNNKENNKKSSPKTKGELSLDDLPPIENLHITVPKHECVELGQVASIVEQLVVVQANKDTPALDLESVLFLKEGEQMLGHVFDVFGPVKEPCYCVRFNSTQHIAEHGVKVGMKVYCAPNLQEHSHFVFLSELLKQKGSDASWEHNNEPPPNLLDYSDDEEESKAKRSAKAQRKEEKNTPEQELKKRHHTYEQRMNARNLRISERHKNLSGPGTAGSTKGGAHFAVTPACRVSRERSVQGRTDFIRPGNSQNNFRPWGQGPGQIKQEGVSWNNSSARNIHHPGSGNVAASSPILVRPPAFSMPHCMLSPPPPMVPLPTSLLQQPRSPFLPPAFNVNIPPPGFSQAAPQGRIPPGFSQAAPQSRISNFSGQNTVFQTHSRSESVPQGLHLGAVRGCQQGLNQVPNTVTVPPPIYRSESMPSLMSIVPPHRFFSPVDAARPPPPPPSSQNRHPTFANTIGNPGAFLNAPNPPLRSMFPNPPPMTPPQPPLPFPRAQPPQSTWNENYFKHEN